jgi:hypothetical protein
MDLTMDDRQKFIFFINKLFERIDFYNSCIDDRKNGASTILGSDNNSYQTFDQSDHTKVFIASHEIKILGLDIITNISFLNIRGYTKVPFIQLSDSLIIECGKNGIFISQENNKIQIYPPTKINNLSDFKKIIIVDEITERFDDLLIEQLLLSLKSSLSGYGG